jgi:hypothetical protein
MEIQNKEYKFICEKCNYKTNRSFDYNTHLVSIRHKNKHSTTNNKEIDTYICGNCEKEFKSQSGLWKHSIKCKKTCTIDNTNIIIEKIMLELQNKDIIVKKETTNTIEIKTNIIPLLNAKSTNIRDVTEVFNDIRIDIKTYANDFYQLEYENIIEKMFKNTFMNIPLLEKPIYCFENENPDMNVCYFYYNKLWIRETEFQWMKQIAYETNDDYPEEKQTILLNIMQLFTDNIMNDISKYKNKDLERKTRADIEFIPTRMYVIQKLMDIVKVNINDFM